MIDEDVIEMIDSMSVAHGKGGPIMASIVVDVTHLARSYCSALARLAQHEPENHERLRQVAVSAMEGATGIICAVGELGAPDMTDADARDFLKSVTAILRKAEQ